MPRTKIRIGTRSSKLALVQVDLAIEALMEAHPHLAGAIEIIRIESTGDANRSQTLEALGGRGIFTDEIDTALADGAIDLAIHAVKDLPTRLPDGIAMAAMLPREDPREALVASTYTSISDLPPGAVIGSASHRRMSFFRHLKPDVIFGLLRGNVEERVAALSRNDCDATILAVAGLNRLGLQRHIKQTFNTQEFPPDPGQGAIGLTCRADDFTMRRLLKAVNHKPTFASVMAERTMLNTLGPNCRIPAGAFAHVSTEANLSLFGALISEDGRKTVKTRTTSALGSEKEIGIAVAEHLMTMAREELAA